MDMVRHLIDVVGLDVNARDQPAGSDSAYAFWDANLLYRWLGEAARRCDRLKGAHLAAAGSGGGSNARSGEGKGGLPSVCGRCRGVEGEAGWLGEVLSAAGEIYRTGALRG